MFCISTFLSVQANIYVVETQKATFGECNGSITVNATGEAGNFTFSVFNTDPNAQQPNNSPILVSRFDYRVNKIQIASKIPLCDSGRSDTKCGSGLMNGIADDG